MGKIKAQGNVHGQGVKSIERYGLLVDKILDQQQVVIKSMEENFFQIPGIAGATILGDGGVSLILDLPGLLKIALQNKQDPLEVS